LKSVSDFMARFWIFDGDNPNYQILSDILEYFPKQIDK